MKLKWAIRKIRMRLFESQRKFSVRFKVSNTTVCNWENGKRVPSLNHLKILVELAKENNVQFDYDEFIDIKEICND